MATLSLSQTNHHFDNLVFDDAIAQTLLIPLYGRAVESRQKNPIITDSYACQLSDYFIKNGQKLSQFGDRRNTVGCAIRAKHFDKQALNFIQQSIQTNQKVPIVVNVGAGLDARCQRLLDIDKKTAKQALFYSVDLPEVLNFRKKLLPVCDNEILLTGSILKTDWLDTLLLSDSNARFIFIIEGVLMYFDEADNRRFLQNLANRFSDSDVHFDISSTLISQRSDKHIAVKHAKARFKFGIDNPLTLQSWHQKIKLIHTYYYGDFPEIKAIGAVWSKLMRYIPLFRHSFKMLHYHILD